VFLIRYPIYAEKSHFNVVLTDEDSFPLSVFLVPLCTPRPKSDRTTIISPIECSCLDYDSFVDYSFLRRVEIAAFDYAEVKWLCSVSSDIVDRIIKGAFQTKLIARGVRSELKDFLSVQ